MQKKNGFICKNELVSKLKLRVGWVCRPGSGTLAAFRSTSVPVQTQSYSPSTLRTKLPTGVLPFLLAKRGL